MSDQLNDDLDSIFDSSSLGNTTAVFTLSSTSTVKVGGWFTEASEGVSTFSGEIEALDPSFTCQTSKVTAVRNKMAARIGNTDYKVQRVQKMGNGVSVVYLSTN